MAKQYVLTGRSFTRFKGTGPDREVERYRRNDLVTLSNEEAERLLGKGFEEPGASERAEAERLQAEADRLRSQAESVEGRADAAEDAAKRVKSGKPAEDDGLEEQTVEELRVEAQAAGVEDPPKRKAELISAIREARSE